MVYFYTTLTILVLLSHQTWLIFRSDNHLENCNENCEDNLEEGCLWPDFCSGMYYLTHIWIIWRLYYFIG